jgi:hypothetical protein
MARKTSIEKRKAAMEMLGIESKQVKKARKKRTLTEEQKQELVNRMAKARESRGPAQNLSVDESIRDLPDDHFLNPDKVKAWLKYQKELLKTYGRNAKDDKDPNIRKEYWDTETYIFNLQRYLNDGVWRDHRYGSEKQSKIIHVCHALAYHPDGTPKRTPGVFYPDLGDVYTNEKAIEDDANYKQKILDKKRLRKTN